MNFAGAEGSKLKSGAKCCFAKCGLTQRKCPQLHFFKFPVNRPSVLEQWLVNCANESLISLSDKALCSRKVCEIHFAPECFTNDMRKYLRKNAVPSLQKFEDYENEDQLYRSASNLFPGEMTANNELVSQAQISSETSSPCGNESTPLPSTCSISNQSQAFPKTTTTPLNKNNKSTGEKKLLTLTKKKLLSRLKKTQNTKKKFYQRAKSLVMRNPKLSREELIIAMKDYLPSAELNFVSMLLDYKNYQEKAWAEEERNITLPMICASPRRKRIQAKQAQEAFIRATTSICSQDDSSTSNLLMQSSDCGTSPSTGNYVETAVKQEAVKEELILEDYGNPNDTMEYQTVSENGEINDLNESAGAALPSSPGGIGGRFETIICDSAVVKIKEEIFEDESDTFGSSLEDEQMSARLTPTAKDSSEPISNNMTRGASPTSLTLINISSKPASERRYYNKRLRGISKANSSEQLQSAVPATVLVKCRNCVNEVFSRPTDLVEHSILKHSDVPSRVFPAVEPSRHQPFSTTESSGLNATTIKGFRVVTFPGINGTSKTASSSTNTPGLSDTSFIPSCATTSSPSVANTPSQPPRQQIPPYFTACDVFDGIFVSLKNIPMENRKTTRDKILELVKFISNENINPASVSFCVMDK